MKIDGSNLRLGRVATIAAKKALLGEEVIIINSGKMVISGDKKVVLGKYKQRRERGTPSTGPFFPKQTSAFVKRTIRGMLPYKQPKGRDALARIKCFSTVPEEMKEEKFDTIKGTHIDDSVASKFVTVKEVCTFLGGDNE